MANGLPNNQKAPPKSNWKRLLLCLRDILYEERPFIKHVIQFIRDGGKEMGKAGWSFFLICVVFVAIIVSMGSCKFQKWLDSKAAINDAKSDHRATTNSDSLAPSPAVQWYLKVEKIESVPPSVNPRIIPPFRIEADVSGQSYSFPTRMMYYAGLTNILESADSVPLRAEREKYDVRFTVWNLRRQLFEMKPSDDPEFSNVVNSTSAQIDEFKINELPARGTNSISLILSQARQLKVIYEITTNR